MIFSTRELKAIALLCKTYEARPMLTTYPQVTVQVKATGEIVTKDIKDVLDAYDDYKKMMARERARARRTEAK